MAKKLGILALVVCMLLAVAVVASAEVSAYPVSDTSINAFSADESANHPVYNDATQDKLHFWHEVIPAYKDPGTNKEPVLVEQNTGNLTGDPAKDTQGLAYWRAHNTAMAGVDKQYAFENKANYDAAYIRDTILAGKDGWKLFKAEEHKTDVMVAAIYRRTCVYCKKYEQCIVPIVHSWVADNTDGQEGVGNPVIGCEEGATLNGKKYKCSVCGLKTQEQIVIPAPGHDWKVVERLSSCTVPGGKGAVCTRCGITSDKKLQKDDPFRFTGKEEDVWKEYDGGKVLGHQWAVSYFTTAGTDTKIKELPKYSGNLYFDNTGALSGKKLFADGHQPANVVVGTLPNCVTGTAGGSFDVVYKCTRPGCDGHKEADDAFDAAAEEFKYPDGGKETVDSKEGLILKVSNVAASGHAFGDRSALIPADCLMASHYTATCKYCGLVKVDEIEGDSAPTGHKFAENVKPVHVTGTNGDEAVHAYTCTVCGAQVTGKCKIRDTYPRNCVNGGVIVVDCDICGFKQNYILVETAEEGKGKLEADDIKEPGDHYGFYLNNESLEDEDLAKWTTKKEKVATSCDKPGMIEYVCNECGKTVKTVQVAGKHDMVMKTSQLEDCTKAWVEYWVCSRENCPGIKVTAGLTGNGKGGKGTDPDPKKGTYTATVSVVDKVVTERRVYDAHEAHTEGVGDDAKKEIEKAATCGKTGKYYILCELCGKQTTEEPYTMPATGKHEYTAAGTLVEATCTEPARVGQICKVCGQVKPGTTAENAENSKALGHNYANPTYYKTKADAEKGKPVKAIDKPTDCTKEYWIRSVCTRCEDVKVEQKKAGEHNFPTTSTHLAPDCTHNDRQAFVCTICGEEKLDVDNFLEAGGDGIADPSLKKTGHTWSDWTLVEDPDATGKNTQHRHVCTVCGYKPDPEPCEYEKDKEQSSDATCSNVEVLVEVCKFCKNAVVTYGTALDPTNHDFEEVAVEGHEATCTAKGFVVEKCPDCGAIGKTIEIDPLGHAWARKDADWTTGLVITTAPTCVKDGVGYRECSICGFKTEDIVIGKYDGANTAYGHTWTRADYVWSADQLIVDVAPTCTVDGKGHYVCADCGYVFETGIPHYDGANTPYGHTWTRADYVWSIDQLKISVEPTCVKDGEGYYECTDCGYKMTGVAVPHYDGANTPYGHIWAREPWPAGLQQHEDGTYYYECPDCHYIQEAE